MSARASSSPAAAPGGHVFPMLAVADALRAARRRRASSSSARRAGSRATRRAGARLRARAARRRAAAGGGVAARGSRRARRARARRARARRPRAAPARRARCSASAATRRARWRSRARCSACRSRSSSRTACSASPTASSRRSRSARTSRGPRSARRFAASVVALRPACRSAAAFRRAPYAPRAGRARACSSRREPGRAGAQRRACPRAIAAVARRVADVEVVHQAGRDATTRCARAYATLGRRARDVSCRSSTTSPASSPRRLVVARSGAGTVAEISAVGRAAIFVPFPFAADDHQRKNAEALASARRRGLHLAARRRRRRGSPTRARALLADDARRAGDGRRRARAAAARTPRGTSRTICCVLRASPLRTCARRTSNGSRGGGRPDVSRSRSARALRRHRRHRHERARRDPAHAGVRRLRLGPARRATSRAASRRSACASTSGTAPRTSHGADVVVYSSAIAHEQPRARRARARSRSRSISRAEMLAELMRVKYGVAIAGSHGKTTTTSLVATVLRAAGLDPTVVVGGKVNALGSNARLGAGDLLVAEADESDGSFLRLTPDDRRRHQHRPRAPRPLRHAREGEGRVRRVREPGAVLRPRGAVPRSPARAGRSCRAIAAPARDLRRLARRPTTARKDIRFAGLETHFNALPRAASRSASSRCACPARTTC